MPYQDDDQFPVNLDTGEGGIDAGAPNTITGMVRDWASRPPQRSSGLHLLLEPDEIATIPGMQDYTEAGSASPGANQLAGNPPGSVSSLDRVSLAPYAGDPGPNPSPALAESAGKTDQAATGVGILGHVMDGWNISNHGVGLFLGQEGADMLDKFTGPAAAALVPAEHALDAYAETSKGAPKFQTWAGAAGKTATTLGGMGVGAMAGAALGGPFMEFTMPLGAAIGGLAPEWMSKQFSNQQFGRAIDRAFQTGG